MVDHDDHSLSPETERQLQIERLSQEMLRVEPALLIEGGALTIAELAAIDGLAEVMADPAFEALVQEIGWPDLEQGGLESRGVHYDSLEDVRLHLRNQGEEPRKNLNNFAVHFQKPPLDVTANEPVKLKSMNDIYRGQPALLRANALATPMFDALRSAVTAERQLAGHDVYSRMHPITVQGLWSAYRLMSRLVAPQDEFIQMRIFGLAVRPDEVQPVTDAHFQLVK